MAFEVMITTGRMLGLDGFVDFDDVELHLVEHVEHVVLEVGVRLVDLVDQQHDFVSATNAWPIFPMRM